MTNIIERTLEAFALALLVAAAVAFWYVTPANAAYNYTCYQWTDNNGVVHQVCNDGEGHTSTTETESE